MENRPRVLITTDIDWASDYLLEIFFERLFSLVPRALAFSTHDSSILTNYADEDLLDIGIHPNFRNNSTHGGDVKSVSSFVSKLFTTHKIYRSHSFLDSAEIRAEMVNHGFNYESNILKYNEPGLRSEQLSEGITRLPCFWSDGWALYDTKIPEGIISKESIKETQLNLIQPGIKILNIHPILFVNNCQSLDHYYQYRSKATTFSKEDYKNFKNTTNVGTFDYFKELVDVTINHCDYYSLEQLLS